ncbi:HDOD domain-containing protein [Nitrosomonas sp. PY1]|uniref:HDOD domain-containing protein n=1 Tax=Nitrosomonas sp. PY1 TaxID=1803906 RepID=UPI001FC7E281|nr:HDOD domain-containing protein [Nitrosomonas sp. PY1]GKS69066.1 HDOD domain-containing protein [Nitrosomonas sp. PY1]
MTTQPTLKLDDGLVDNKIEELSVKNRLLNFIDNNPDLPTLGNSISGIVQLSSSDDQSTDQLANLILADVALTQKILRLANTVTFRGTSNQVVTNISRAIQLLGLDAVKGCALAMILIDRMPGKHSRFVRKELMYALTASLISHKLAKQSCFANAEEVAIAALFKNMGRLLVAAFDHALYKEVMDLVKSKKHSQTQASLKVLGINYDALTEFAMKQWSIPEVIINAMKLVPAKTLAVPKNRQEWMRQVTEFSDASAQFISASEESEKEAFNEKLLKRFGNSLNIDETKLDMLVSEVTEEAQVISSQINLQLSESAQAEVKDDSKDSNLSSDESYPSGKPAQALELLFGGLQAVNTLISTPGYKINALILLILETLYKSLGFSFATICLKDIKTNQYRARQCLGGRDSVEVQQNFVFSDTASDVFGLSMKKNVDLLITDSKDNKVQSMLPAWHLELFSDTRSFMILPLIVESKPIGLYYFDRQNTAVGGITDDEMKVIKEIKKEILIALKSWL